jgi:hypothetical protein
VQCAQGVQRWNGASFRGDWTHLFPAAKQASTHVTYETSIALLALSLTMIVTIRQVVVAAIVRHCGSCAALRCCLSSRSRDLLKLSRSWKLTALVKAREPRWTPRHRLSWRQGATANMVPHMQLSRSRLPAPSLASIGQSYAVYKLCVLRAISVSRRPKHREIRSTPRCPTFSMLTAPSSHAPNTSSYLAASASSRLPRRWP